MFVYTGDQIIRVIFRKEKERSDQRLFLSLLAEIFVIDWLTRDASEFIYSVGVIKRRMNVSEIVTGLSTDGSGRTHIHKAFCGPDLTTGKLIDGRLKLHENAREMLLSDEQSEHRRFK